MGMGKVEYLEMRIRNLTKQLEIERAKENVFGTNADYETGTILAWVVAEGNHTVTAVKHSSGYWFTSYREVDRYTFDELITRIADRPCYIVTEMQQIN